MLEKIEEAIERGFDAGKSKLRFIFSVEFIVSIALSIGLLIAAVKIGWLPRYYGRHSPHKVIEAGILIFSMLIVYGIGEIIRSRFKCKSIIFDKPKNKTK